MQSTAIHTRLFAVVYGTAKRSNIERCVIYVANNIMLFAAFFVFCSMKQYRLTDTEKVALCNLHETGKYNCKQLAEKFKISSTAIQGLLKRRGYKLKSQSELQRKYPINETFFDVIDTEQKAYFLGLLYADGYNNTDRNSVSLSLQEQDKSVLEKLNDLLQPAKPLQYVKMNTDNRSNQYRLVIANKRISARLQEIGCGKAKTFVLSFPNWLQQKLIPSFVRGYFDGDGCIQPKQCNVTSTEDFCLGLRDVLLQQGINCSIDTRHPERKHNIRTLHISGRKQSLKFLEWIYEDAAIYLDRKYETYLNKKEYRKEIRQCSVEGCGEKHMAIGYCKNHYYEYNNGKEKRHARWMEKRK